MPIIKSDRAVITDDVLVNGTKFYEGASGGISGLVDVLYRSKETGRPLFTKSFKGHNDLLVNGAVYFSEKANNTRSRFLTLPLDVELGVHVIEELDRTNATISQETICGFMVGNLGTGDTYNAVRPVRRTDRSVPGPLPFRVVKANDDLKGAERDKYFMRVVKGDYAYYYGKKFEVNREICIMFEDGTVVPLDVDTTVPTKFVKVFTRYKAYVEQADIREFFKLTQGSTLKSLVNTVGLITGYPGEAEDGREEFFNIRGITTMNMENLELKDSESTIDFNYRVHVQ